MPSLWRNYENSSEGTKRILEMKNKFYMKCQKKFFDLEKKSNKMATPRRFELL